MLTLNTLSLGLQTGTSSLLASGAMNFDLMVADLGSIHKLDRYISLTSLADAATSAGLSDLQYAIAAEIDLLSDESLSHIAPEMIASLHEHREQLEIALENVSFLVSDDEVSNTISPQRRVDAGPHTFFALKRTPNLITQFGPILHSLWQRGPQAHELLQKWSFQLDRPGRSEEQHQFIPQRSETDRIASRLISQGYYVRYGPIPKHLVPSLPEPNNPREVTDNTVQWLVARAGANEINRTLERLRRSPDPEPIFTLDYRPIPQARDAVQVLQPNELQRLTAQRYGQSITMQDLNAACHIDIDGFRVSRLTLSPYPEDGLRFTGRIENTAGEEIGIFSRCLPAPPKPGKPWIAYGDGFQIPNPELQGKGIGREVTQRFMALFYHLGVDILEFGASDTGAHIWPRFGFDFADTITRDTMLIRFIEYLQEKAHRLSPGELSRIRRIRYAWELVDFRLDNGLHAGEAFLKYHGEEKKKKYRVRFWLHPEYPGWTKLLKASYPPEWDKLHAKTKSVLLDFFREQHLLPEIILSDQEHVRWIQDRIGNWLFGIMLYLEKHKKNQLDSYTSEDIESLEEELFYVCDILRAMMNEHHQGTELGRLFWQRLNTVTRHHLPDLIEGVRALNAIKPRYPVFVDKAANIPRAYPPSWNGLSLNTLRQLRTQANGLSKPPDTPKQYADFLRKQLNEWMSAASRYCRHLDKQTIHQLDPDTLFIHYRALFWIADVLNMLQQELHSTDEFIYEFHAVLDKHQRTSSRLEAMIPRLRKVLGLPKLSLPRPVAGTKI